MLKVSKSKRKELVNAILPEVHAGSRELAEDAADTILESLETPEELRLFLSMLEEPYNPSDWYVRVGGHQYQDVLYVGHLPAMVRSREGRRAGPWHLTDERAARPALLVAELYGEDVPSW